MSLPPPPPSIGLSSFSSFSSRRNCGTCVDLPDPVDPASIATPFLCMVRAIRSLCDNVGRQLWTAECSDLQAVSATSPPPSGTIPRRRHCHCCHHPSPLRCSATPPFQPAPVRVLGGVQWIDSRCMKPLPSLHSSPLPRSLGVLLSLSLPLSSSALPPSRR